MPLQTIELFIKDDEDGVFAISLVDDPAIQEGFVALSEDANKFNLQLKEVDKERKVVVGFALIPDFEIYRKQNGKEFNIKFSKETVDKAAKLYMKQLNLNNVTAEHEKPVQGCCVVESWIVEDAKHDKSNLWDLGAKGGEWVVMMQLTDEEHAKVKDGVYSGFSIEAMFNGFEQLNSAQTNEDKLSQIKDLLNIK